MNQQPDIVDRTFKFAVDIVKFAGQLNEKSSIQRILSSQILRSGTSIGANIEEGQAAESKADFIHKYNVALKEARETRYWLRILDTSKITNLENVDILFKESDEICRIIAQIIINAKKEKK